MNTKEFKVGDRVQRTAREILKGMVLQIKDYKGTVVQVRDCEPSLGVIWDGYTKITWYISSSGVFEKVEEDISDKDKNLVTGIINSMPNEEESEFKIGDRVRCVELNHISVKNNEEGVILTINNSTNCVGVRWDFFSNRKHDLIGACENGHGWFMYFDEIKKIEDSEELEGDIKKPVLSPKEMLKAGMVVEMADGDFGLFDGERILYHDGFDEIAGLDDDLQDIYVSHKMDVYDTSDEFSIVAIYQPTCGYTLQTLNIKVGKFEVIWKKEGFVRKFKKEFSKDELIILENIHHDGYEYIARNKDGGTMLFVSDKIKKLVTCWSSECGADVGLEYVEGLFQCISWEDEEPVKISDFI